MKNTSMQPWRQKAVLFLLSQGISLFGSAIVQMAIIWHVALVTSSGIWVTLLTISASVPQMLISLLAGAWADRCNRKTMIIAADAAIAAATLALALCLMASPGSVSLPIIVLVSAIRSLGSGIQTPAVNALLPQLVPQDHLIRFNGINSSVQSVVQFAAPLVAGALLTAGSLYSLLFIDVITACLSIGILLCIKAGRYERPVKMERTPFFAEIKAGITYARRNRQVLRALLSFGAFIFLSVPSGFLSVLMIERTFGSEILYLSTSEMVGFAGMVLGGLALGAWGGFADRGKTLGLGLACYAIFSILLGLTPVFWLYAVFMFLISFAIPVVQSAVMTTLQESTVPDMQGRVFGLMNMMYTGFMPLGMALFGPLADVLRIQTLVILCGILIFAFALFSLRTRRETAGA